VTRQENDSNGAPARIKLRLYVAGHAPNSARALTNLETICEEYGKDRFEIEIVDVLDDPLRALEDRVLVTPTLIKMAPPPAIQIAGDLSRRYDVLHALGLSPWNEA
jgi:circadian clock protein KaiB